MTQHVVVTGAGTGIGRAIARHLAETGHSVLMLGRSLEALEETRNTLEDPETHQCFSCDVTRSDRIRDALIASGIPSLYGVVVNAGLGTWNRYGEGDQWQAIIDTNLTGSYNTIHECLPYLRRNNDGFRKIIFMSSILARYGAPGYAAYCASKAGVLGLMRSLAAELAPESILVNAICPSWVDTQMAHSFFEDMARAIGITRDEVFRTQMSATPLGKMSTPDEVARLVGFLMSDAETSITGQAIDINNGALMV